MYLLVAGHISTPLLSIAASLRGLTKGKLAAPPDPIIVLPRKGKGQGQARKFPFFKKLKVVNQAKIDPGSTTGQSRRYLLSASLKKIFSTVKTPIK